MTSNDPDDLTSYVHGTAAAGAGNGRARVEIRRLKTGVPGLDEILGGGLPEYSFNLIAGQPGCGKTTLAHQMMFAMATPERPALYCTVLGEPPLKMLRYQQQFDFFDESRVNTSIRFMNLGAQAQAGDLDAVLSQIVEAVQAQGSAFVFVDSFRSVTLAGTAAGASDHSMQSFVQQLGVVLTSLQATTFLIGEYATDGDVNPVFTVSDGLFWMRQGVHRNSMVRKMEIRKMRGQATLPGLHTYRINGRGIELYPPAGAAPSLPGAPKPQSGRASMGVPELDAMMGGGLPLGYSLLVAGPSGSGKSILAAAFLAEGARQGETGVIAVFEQHPNRSHSRVVADLIATDRVGLVESHSADLSIDEIVRLLLDEIQRLGATRVVIDSLSGFELAIAPTFREDFRESLARLVAALATAGVTVLMTSELEDRYSDLRFSPYGTAFMTDAIVVQRYVELDSRLRRMIAVVKVRASAHADELRLFTIDDGGIRIEGTVLERDGLLGGRPASQRPGRP